MAMGTIQRPHCTLLERRCHDVCFDHAQSEGCWLAFFAIPQHPMAMPLRCWGDVCNRTVCTSANCIYLGCHEIAVRTLLWCDRGFK